MAAHHQGEVLDDEEERKRQQGGRAEDPKCDARGNLPCIVPRHKLCGVGQSGGEAGW